MNTKLALAVGGALVSGLLAATSANAVPVRNGTSVNGISVNGISVNGLRLNGLRLNGLRLNGTSVDGQAACVTDCMDGVNAVRLPDGHLIEVR